MYRRIVATAATSALVALAVGGGAFASASGGGGSHHVRSFTVIGKQTQQTVVNVDGNGFGPGDEFIFSEDLWNTQKTHKLGTLSVICTVVSAQKGSPAAHCVGTARFKGGSIEAAGLSPERGTTVVAITGGTGSYIGASGQIIIRELNKQGTLERQPYQLLTR